MCSEQNYSSPSQEKIAYSCAYYICSILIFGKVIFKRNFHQISSRKARAGIQCTLSLNVYLPWAISQMKALLSRSKILLKRLSFLVISARSLFILIRGSRHFEIFSCAPLSQVQISFFLFKPMCHALVFQEERSWISRLINFHSSSVSIETR